MAIDTCDPDGDSAPVAWNPSVGATHWQCIDGGIRQPNAPTSDNIFAGDGDENDQATVTMDNGINDVNEVTEIKIWTYGNNTSGEPCQVRIYCGAWAANQTLDMVTGYGWFSRTFAGSWTQAQLDGLLVRYTADSAYGKADGTWIRACYAEVTYSQVAVGYGHDFMGVPAANIDEVNGIPAANIDTIKGV